MRENLNRSHNEFRVGFLTSLTGVAILVTSLATNEETQKTLVIAGSIVTFIGSVIMIDSHKFIGDAARWKFTANSITFDF